MAWALEHETPRSYQGVSIEHKRDGDTVCLPTTHENITDDNNTYSMWDVAKHTPVTRKKHTLLEEAEDQE